MVECNLRNQFKVSFSEIVTVTKEDWYMFPINNALEQTREVREKQL